MDVLRVPILQQLLAGGLPAAGGQRDAEGAGVPVGHPCPLGTVPYRVVQGGVCACPLDKAAHAAGQVLGVLVLGGVHHAGYLAIAGSGGRLCCGQQHPLGLGQCIIHLAGKLRAALAVPGSDRVGVGDQRFGIVRAVQPDVLPHLLPGSLVQPGEPGNVIIPCPCRYLHRPSPSAAPARAPAVPAP